MKLLILGAGSIGERHIRNLKSLHSNVSIDVYEPQSRRLTDICNKYGSNPVDPVAIDSVYDCVFICTPPASHLDLAKRALEAGSNVFIEKPLSSSIDGIDALSDLSFDKKLLTFVAYNFRFNKGLTLVKKLVEEHRFGKVLHASSYFGQYLPDWRPWQDYRSSYTANKRMGGGIIYDGSHEVDYLMWIFGQPKYIQSHFAQTDILAADTEAIADILLGFDNIPAYIHLDFIRREYRRSLELLCENGVIQWSLSENQVRTFDALTKKWIIHKIDESINDMYVAEVTHVLDCINLHEKSDLIDLDNGISTLKVSNTIFQAGLSGKRIVL